MLGHKLNVSMKEKLDQLSYIFEADLGSPIERSFLDGDDPNPETKEETSRFLVGSWLELDSEVWFEHPNSSSFLKPRALVYFLPSLMTASFRSPRRALLAVENFMDDFTGRRGFGLGLEQDLAFANLGIARILIVLGWLRWLEAEIDIDPELVRASSLKIIDFINE